MKIFATKHQNSSVSGMNNFDVLSQKADY